MSGGSELSCGSASSLSSPSGGATAGFVFNDTDNNNVTILSIDGNGNTAPVVDMGAASDYQTTATVGSYYEIESSGKCLAVVEVNGAGKATIS